MRIGNAACVCRESKNRLEDKLTATTLMKKLFCLALVAVAAILVGCNKAPDTAAPAGTNAPAK